MATFEFQYNIGDILRFKWQTERAADGSCCGGISRGTVKGILIGEEKSGYMVETCNGLKYVAMDDVCEAVYSTKSFDVMYPGLEIEYRRFGDDRPDCFIYATIESAQIDRYGRLQYWIYDEDGQRFCAPEGKVFLVKSDENLKHYN